MKTQQPELRAIPQFDLGRWKVRLERVPINSDNETTKRVDVDSAAQANVNKLHEAHWLLCYQSSPV
jgi:hypothetical protein